MGSYCRFCGQRCFVVRVIPDGPCRGWSGCLATCQRGMMHDLGQTGHTHITAVNPVTHPELAAAAARACDHDGRACSPVPGDCLCRCLECVTRLTPTLHD